MFPLVKCYCNDVIYITTNTHRETNIYDISLPYLCSLELKKFVSIDRRLLYLMKLQFERAIYKSSTNQMIKRNEWLEQEQARSRHHYNTNNNKKTFI